MEDAIHKLEQDIIEFKASQGIGSSSSRILKAGEIDFSSTMYMDKYIIIVFKGKSIHPIIMPRLECRINGSKCKDLYLNGVRQTGNVCWLNYDTTMMLGTLYYHNDADSNTFNEYTTGVYIQVGKDDFNEASVTVKGTLYASCEGEMRIYSYDP